MAAPHSSEANRDIINVFTHVACKPPHVHSDPRICEFFTFQKSIKDHQIKFVVIFIALSNDRLIAAEQESVAVDNEQIVGSPVIESLSDFLLSSGSLQATSSSAASRRQTLPRRSLIASAFRFMSTASKAFSKTTGLPLNSSPAPFGRSEKKFPGKRSVMDGRTDMAEEAETTKMDTRADLLRSVSANTEDSGTSDNESICTKRSASSSSGLLCNFEESALNGRLEPAASLDGFQLQITASGATCSPHIKLPVTTFFFEMPEDEAPLPYLGLCSLEHMRKGYRIPKKGNIQAVLFNPQGTVVRMFLVKFDVRDMPPSSQTFLRQRTFFMPVGCPFDEVQRSWLKYLIHLR
ncbi:unnamed protein product [Gongylonema pulchrum]|uniref:DUF4210 domain-containing protein n=1 Tax=Gongylonema pulchrum TaxID=637853 RepID=A0A183EMI3_9BILA|nr:unnamed protein product [Gongylonema pulchrum]